MDYTAQPIGEFLSAIASAEVAPAGGTAAAVVGAVGASLCEMACIHTRGGTTSADASIDLQAIRADLEKDRDRLLGYATTDAAVVAAVFAADCETVTPEDRKQSVGVPLAIAEVCLDVLEHGRVLREQGSPNTAADVVTGLLLTESALRSCAYTVRTNLEFVEDETYVAQESDRIAAVEDSADGVLSELSIGAGGTE